MSFITAIFCMELELPCLDLASKGEGTGHSLIGLSWESNDLSHRRGTVPMSFMCEVIRQEFKEHLVLGDLF